MSCTLNTNFETGPNLLQCMSLLVALFDVCRDAPILPQLEHKRTLRGHHECVAIDPKRRFAAVNFRTAKGSFDHLVGAQATLREISRRPADPQRA